MKTAIIFLLLVALVGGAALSRPSQDDFKQYITTRYTQGDKGLLKIGLDQFRADSFLGACTFNNRVLWIDVQKDGKTIYTGAFAHWFSRAEVKAEMNKDLNSVKEDVKGVKQQVESIKIGK